MRRDEQSGALISNDKSALDKYRKEKRLYRDVANLIERISALEHTVNTLVKHINERAE